MHIHDHSGNLDFRFYVSKHADDIALHHQYQNFNLIPLAINQTSYKTCSLNTKSIKNGRNIPYSSIKVTYPFDCIESNSLAGSNPASLR